MAYDMEGEVQIPSEDFWAFVLKYVPDTGAEYLFGPPRMDNGNNDLILTFAASTSVHPAEWATPPKAKTEWMKP